MTALALHACTAGCGRDSTEPGLCETCDRDARAVVQVASSLGGDRCVDPCPPAGERRTWIDGHPADRPEFAPRVVKNPDPGNRYWAWLVVCDLSVDVCQGHGERKRDLLPIVNDPARRLRWLEFATDCAERAGLLVTAFVVDPPPSACVRWQVEPWDKGEPDRDGVYRGGLLWTVGVPVIRCGLLTADAVAAHRLGWTRDRARAAVMLSIYDRDRIDWVAAWSQARADILTGLARGELDAHGVSPEVEGYLRLDEYQRGRLAERIDPGDRLYCGPDELCSAEVAT